MWQLLNVAKMHDTVVSTFSGIHSSTHTIGRFIPCLVGKKCACLLIMQPGLMMTHFKWVGQIHVYSRLLECCLFFLRFVCSLLSNKQSCYTYVGLVCVCVCVLSLRIRVVFVCAGISVYIHQYHSVTVRQAYTYISEMQPSFVPNAIMSGSKVKLLCQGYPRLLHLIELSGWCRGRQEFVCFPCHGTYHKPHKVTTYMVLHVYLRPLVSRGREWGRKKRTQTN